MKMESTSNHSRYVSYVKQAINVLPGTAHLLGDAGSYSTLQFVFLLIFTTAIVTALWRLVVAASGRIKGGRSIRKPVVLILGPTNAGKTLLFYRLLGDSEVTTVSSLRPNSISVHDAPSDCPFVKHVGSAEIDLVDFPGHTRLAPQSTEYLGRARAIVYVLDSTDKAAIKQGAEQLYDLFLYPEVCQKETPLLVVCNKSDLPAAKTKNGVVEDVLREIERLRASRSAALEGEDEAAKFVGVEGKVFKFEDASIPISICATSVLTNDIAGVVEFFASNLE